MNFTVVLHQVTFRALLVTMAVALGFPAAAQQVSEKFNHLTFSENFDTVTSRWTTLANADNLFIIQDGEYILSRRTTVSPFAILVDYENNFSGYRLVASLKLERAGDDGLIGVIFMAQPGGGGGLIFEINTEESYRVRQISGGTYKMLTGTGKSAGWVGSRHINPNGAYNLLDVRTAGGVYDLYINGRLVHSFSEPAYTSGNFGLVIGPGSKGRTDFMYLFTRGKGAVSVPDNEVKEAEPGLIELTESIIRLQTQINKLKEENQDLRRTIEAMESYDTDVQARQRDCDARIAELQAKIDNSAFTFDSLVTANEKLHKYKEMVTGNENADLIITLSQQLKAERKKTEALQEDNKKLREKLRKGDGTGSAKSRDTGRKGGPSYHP